MRDQDGWICHVLRREAEAMILPDLPAFLGGNYQPRDNDERLALLGVCQFTNRTPRPGPPLRRCLRAQIRNWRKTWRPAIATAPPARPPWPASATAKMGAISTRGANAVA